MWICSPSTVILHEQDMSRALTYVIVGYPNSEYVGMAIHLAAQLLLMDGQFEDSQRYFSNLIVNPPKYHSPPGSCLDLFPDMVYDYSVTLESSLL
jgi:hypothetical protein